MRNKMPPENQKVMLVVCETNSARPEFVVVLESQHPDIFVGDEFEFAELIEEPFLEIFVVKQPED